MLDGNENNNHQTSNQAVPVEHVCFRCNNPADAFYCDACRPIVVARAKAEHEDNGEARCDSCDEWHPVVTMTRLRDGSAENYWSDEYRCHDCL